MRLMRRIFWSTSCLILLTSDGDIVNKILRARNNHEKEYIVHVNKPVNHEFISRMRNGLPILGTKTHLAEAETRIPDGILYINGLPLVVFEFKEVDDAKVDAAHRVAVVIEERDDAL